MSLNVNQDIHVLHVLNSAHGGSALSTFQLIGELKKRNITSSLVCFNNAHPAQKEVIEWLVDNRILFIPLYWTNKRIRVKWWKRPLLEMYTLLKTWKGYRYQNSITALIKMHGINLVHTSTLVNPEGAIAARINKLPHVWHVRELIGPGTYYQFLNYKKWAAGVSSSASVLVANSTITMKNLLQFFQESKIRYVPNGIDIGPFLVKNHQVSENPIVIGMVANLTSRLKNHEFFIRTAAVFVKDPMLEFRIYGTLPADDDEYLRHLKSIIDKNQLATKVKFMGHRSSPAEIMKEIDVLFHTTGLESFGRIFTEAMAGGIPVVAVDQGGALELIQPEVNGYLVKNNDKEGAALQLKKLTDPDIRNVFGRNGRSIVERYYTLERSADQIVELYKEVLSKSEKKLPIDCL